MVRLANLPSQGVIDGLSGVVDFYVYHPSGEEGKGVPCARSWPRYDESVMTAASKEQRAPFAYVNQRYRDLSPTVLEAWHQMASMTGLTPRDLATRAYINGDRL